MAFQRFLFPLANVIHFSHFFPISITLLTLIHFHPFHPGKRLIFTDMDMEDESPKPEPSRDYKDAQPSNDSDAMFKSHPFNDRSARLKTGPSVWTGICGKTPFLCLYFCDFARLSVIMGTFWALLSSLANRSTMLWACTKPQKDDKITKLEFCPSVRSYFCPKSARLFTKMSLSEELGTLGVGGGQSGWDKISVTKKNFMIASL